MGMVRFWGILQVQQEGGNHLMATGYVRGLPLNPSQTILTPQEYAWSPIMDQVEQQENLLPDPLPTDE